ncbi:MAG: IPT/TIG domain-containing protein [Chitinophagaceae bacterium]|nr:IPT/TIG domain-containing protein [Chitinophagaceae bacterium]
MKSLSVVCLLIVALLAACNKNDDDDNGGGGGGGGNLTITSTSPDYVFWGEELTVDGTGFSTNASENIVYIKGNKSCDSDTTWQKAAVVSATATRLVVKVPYIKKENGVYCGADYGRVRVTVGNQSVTREQAVKFVGPLKINICHPFGITIGAYPNTYRTGDSSVMTAHLYTLYGRESGYYDKIKLYINGSPVNTVDRYFKGATCGGLTFKLEPEDYADINNCTIPDGYNGDQPVRKFRFIAKVDGTAFADTTDGYVFNHPKMSISGSNSPGSVSKSAGGNPTVKVTGKYMYFTRVRWSDGLSPAFHTDAPPISMNDTETSIYIPLSLMLPGRTYNAVAIGPCDLEVPLFGVSIVD